MKDEKPMPQLIAIQMKGNHEDPLLTRLERYAEKKGLQKATAARMLIKAALDAEGQK